jgi:hypothetical protein
MPNVPLLDLAGNFAIVHLPGRRYPALTLQGDTLNSLLQSAADAQKALESGGVSKAAFELEKLVDRLEELRTYYAAVLVANGHEELPWPV